MLPPALLLAISCAKGCPLVRTLRIGLKIERTQPLSPIKSTNSWPRRERGPSRQAEGQRALEDSAEDDGHDEERAREWREVPRSGHLTNVALVLPARNKLEATPVSEGTHYMNGKPDGGAEIAVPAAVFNLPADADARFERFARACRVGRELRGLRSSAPQWKVITKMRAGEGR